MGIVRLTFRVFDLPNEVGLCKRGNASVKTARYVRKLPNKCSRYDFMVATASFNLH